MLQTLLMYMFYILTLLGLSTLLFVRKIDARTVFLISTLVYGLPLFFGYTEYTLTHSNGGMIYHDNIVPEIYIIFILLLIAYLISLLKVTKKTSLNEGRNTKTVRSFFDNEILLISLYISLLISVVAFIGTTGLDTFTISVRSEKIEYYTVWYYIAGTISVCTTILSIIMKKSWKYFTLPLAYLLFDLFMGDRTFLFLGVISFVISYFNSKEILLNLKARLKMGFILILILITAFVYKPFYFAISLGTFKWGNIDDYFSSALIGSEPFVIMGNLNEIIKYGGISLDTNYFIESIIGYFPLYETLSNNSREGFNSIFQGLLFPYTEWGLGSTSFGEIYSLGGMIGILIYIIFITFFLKYPVPSNNIFKMLYFFIVPYLLFYYHRTDWTYFIAMIRYFSFSFILILPIYYFLYIIKKGIKTHRVGLKV